MRARRWMGLVITLFVVGCWDGVDGNGQRVEAVEALAGFTAIDNGSDLAVSVERGDVFGVVVSIDEDLLEFVDLHIDGDTLHIETTENIDEHVPGPNVRVTMPSLLSAHVEGSGSLDAFAFRESAPVRLRVSGSGNMDYEGSAPTLQCTVRGSGDLQLRGTSDRLEGNVQGSGDLHAKDLSAASASLSVAGSGNLTATVNGPTEARVSGSGDIDLFGSPVLGITNIRGSGDLNVHN